MTPTPARNVTFTSQEVLSAAIDLGGHRSGGAAQADPRGQDLRNVLGAGSGGLGGLALAGDRAYAAAALAGHGRALQLSGIAAHPSGGALVGRAPEGATGPLGWQGTERAPGVHALLAGLEAGSRPGGEPAQVTLSAESGSRLIFALTAWHHSGEPRMLALAGLELALGQASGYGEQMQARAGWKDAGLDPATLDVRLRYSADYGGVQAPGARPEADLGGVTGLAAWHAPEGASEVSLCEPTANGAFLGARRLRIWRVGEALFIHWPVRDGAQGEVAGAPHGVQMTSRLLAARCARHYASTLRFLELEQDVPAQGEVQALQEAHRAWQGDAARAGEVAALLAGLSVLAGGRPTSAGHGGGARA